MTSRAEHLGQLADLELLATVRRLRAAERETTADLVAALAELERRGLHLAEGFPSMYVYCTQRLGFSEHEAYARIHAARVAGSYPVVLPMLSDGRLTLTAITLVSQHLTEDNHMQLLEAAAHKSKRELLELLAALYPQPALPSSLMRVPSPSGKVEDTVDVAGGTQPPDADPSATVGETTAVAEALAAFARSAVVPLSPDRYKLEVTISREAYEVLRRIQNLCRHIVPDGDLAPLTERAFQVLLADLERRKLAQTERPHRFARCRSGSRYVPAHVRRAVWQRDGGQCAYVGPRGRCQEHGFLELHHVIPFAEGGQTTVGNLELRCRSHNQYEQTLLDTG